MPRTLFNMERSFIFKQYSVSTNTELKEAVRLSDRPVWDVICADTQTGGRGRRGNSFFSPDGGVYFSAAYPLEETDNLPFLTLLAGLAAAETLDSYGVYVQIKWPNDLYLRGKKLCGILTELVSLPAGNTAVVGVGLNLRLRKEELPPQLRETVTSLQIENVPLPNRETLVHRTVSKLDAFVYAEHALQNTAVYAERINKRAYLTDKRVKTVSEEARYSGTVKGVGADGSLELIENTGKIRRVYSGTVIYDE